MHDHDPSTSMLPIVRTRTGGTPQSNPPFVQYSDDFLKFFPDYFDVV
jgi:hypothetical protein